MDYAKIYENLVESRRIRTLNDDEFYQQHHIIPRSMGGTEDAYNLVKLTLREHLLAHWLLWRIHKNASMGYAFSLMSKQSISLSKLMGEKGEKIRKSGCHEEAKFAHSFANTCKSTKFERTSFKRKYSLSDERKLQISEFFREFEKTQEHKNKIGIANSIALKGRKMSDDEMQQRNHSSKLKGRKRNIESIRKSILSRKNSPSNEERFYDINTLELNFLTNEWLKILCDKWNLSPNAVRTWVKRYVPEKYYSKE